MASITIRHVDEATKKRLRVRAAEHGRSMEAEAREILREGLASQKRDTRNLVEMIRARIEPLGGVELPELPPEFMGDPVIFEE